MNGKRGRVTVGLVIVLTCIALLQVGRVATSQSTPQTTAVGRYQLQVVGPNVAYVIDTATGQTWRRDAYVAAQWEKQPALPAPGR